MYILGKFFFSTLGFLGTFLLGFISALGLEFWFLERKWKQLLGTLKGKGEV